MRGHPSLRRDLGRGELVRLIYRLGRHGASGVLTIRPRGPAAARPEVFALRRGFAIDRAGAGPEAASSGSGSGSGELGRRAVAARLVRLAAQDDLSLVFEGGVTAVIPPGASNGISLAAWARAHLEQQLDGSLAEVLVGQLAGVRLTLRPELAPEPVDEADRRMLAAMDRPRRLDQIWPLARTPRFRLLAFLHFLRAVDALECAGVAASAGAPSRASAGAAFGASTASVFGASAGAAGRVPNGASAGAPHVAQLRGPDPRRLAALRTLGIDGAADPDDVKRAYRRLARALHPDLQPNADAERRRVLERRFAEVTAAYDALA